MADFSPPFGSGGETRLPTVDEQSEGFACGPADRELFGGLFRRIEAELGAVVTAGAITPSNSDDTTVLQAILALIDAATGGGDPSGYVTMAQARARLPIFPDVQTTDGTIGVTTPGTGQIRIPSGVIFQHRGIFPVTTPLLDIATGASKTYHLRWNPTDGFALKDLSDTGYNPSVLLDGNSVFDSTFDDMLVARVITNSSNVPVVVNLSNKIRLSNQSTWRAQMAEALNWTTMNSSAVALNWARTPILADLAFNGFETDSAKPDGTAISFNLNGAPLQMGVRIPAGGLSRYSIPNFQYHYQDSARNLGLASVVITALAV